MGLKGMSYRQTDPGRGRRYRGDIEGSDVGLFTSYEGGPSRRNFEGNSLSDEDATRMPSYFPI
jgi:hypothetical protein